MQTRSEYLHVASGINGFMTCRSNWTIKPPYTQTEFLRGSLTRASRLLLFAYALGKPRESESDNRMEEGEPASKWAEA